MVAKATTRHGHGDEHRRLAVLIDADNAQPAVIESLLAEVAKFGIASSKRIYGDWTSTSHAQWKKVLLQYSVTPVQQFAYTKGKNATDCSMIIDAMDLMYTRRFDGFCLVSSDSDFTRLAQRLREEGHTVYGFGEKKTPESFVAACDKFIYTEILQEPSATESPKFAADTSRRVLDPSRSETTSPAGKPTNVGSETATSKTSNALPLDLIFQAIEEASDDSGWANLGAVGSYVQKIRPDFDPRLYGCKKFSDLIKKYPKCFVVEDRGAPGSSSKTVVVRAAGN